MAATMATASWRSRLGDDGMRPPKFRRNCSSGRWVIAFQTFFNMAAVRHLELEFCHSGPPTKSTMLFGCPVKIWCRSDICRRRYCDFIILLVWVETRLYFGFFGGFESLKIVGCASLGQSRHLIHKRLNPSKGSSWGKLPDPRKATRWRAWLTGSRA